MSSKKKIEKDLKDLKILNKRKALKLRAKKLSDNSYSMYLDYWNGTRHEYQFLKIYLQNKVSNYTEDLTNLEIAIEIRNTHEKEIQNKEAGFIVSNWKKNADFILFFEGITQTKKKSDKSWFNTLKHLRDFKPSIKIKFVDEKFCEEVTEYFKSKVSNNTAHTYLSKLKASLNIAVRKGIIPRNPANDIQIKKTQAVREFLTDEEIKAIKETDFEYIEIKNSFLFSCFTGLRISDIRKLKFSDIENEHLSIRQQKTQELQRMKLSNNALKIIEFQRNYHNSESVFEHIQTNENTILRKLIKKAGITKYITFHCGRHTFVTRCLTHGIDLYTVSKLTGHKNQKTTEIYAKLIDKKRDEAIDSLPEI